MTTTTEATTHIEITASISDGMSRNAGGSKRFSAESYEAAVDLAKEWAREGDYTSEDGSDVDVMLVIADADDDEVLERVTVACPATKG